MAQQDMQSSTNAQEVVPLDLAAPQPPARKTPRVWPAITLVAAFWLFRLIASHLELTTIQRFGGTMLVLALTTLLFLAWWLISRRTSWVERVTGLVGCIVFNIVAAKLA